MIMIINKDDNDDDYDHIYVRVKLDCDLLIPSSIFPFTLASALHSRKKKLLCWKISVGKSHEISCFHDDLMKISYLVGKSDKLL